MKVSKNARLAFSMIELVFVIVVLGIVASISSSTIVEVFKSYIPQKASALASEKTELATMQIANRLSNSVPWSLTTHNNAGVKVPLTSSDVATGDVIEPLEWIGIDNDGFSAANSWSGFCDTVAATETTCPTNGSNLINANSAIKGLSGNQVDLTGTTQQPVIIFKNANDVFTDDNLATPAVEEPKQLYSPACMGMITADKSCAITATAPNATTIGMSSGPKSISEHYVLAWSAYALTPENCEDRNGDGIVECDLALYSNYQPWHDETIANGTRSVLLNNVTIFKFTQYQGTIKFKVCVQQTIGDNTIAPITTCKEKTVIR